MLLKACCSCEVARGSAGARWQAKAADVRTLSRSAARRPADAEFTHLWRGVGRRRALIPLSFEAIRKCVHTGPKPFGFPGGVAAQTVRFGLSKPRTAIFDKDFLDVSAWQRVKA